MSVNLGIKIKALRESLNLTLEEFGDLIGNTTKSNVHAWENGKSNPNNKKLKRIAEIAGKSLDDFLNENSRDLSILEAKYLRTNLKKLEKRINNIKNILEAYSQVPNDQLNLLCEAPGVDEEITNQEYILQLEKELYISEQAYIKESTKLIDIQYDLLNGQNIPDLDPIESNPIEMFFESSYPLSINAKLLTAEEKKRALEILKLVFK